jgi:hypothetical protein
MTLLWPNARTAALHAITVPDISESVTLQMLKYGPANHIY